MKGLKHSALAVANFASLEYTKILYLKERRKKSKHKDPNSLFEKALTTAEELEIEKENEKLEAISKIVKLSIQIQDLVNSLSATKN